MKSLINPRLGCYLFVVASIVSFSRCASTGSVRETSHLQATLSSYPIVRIQVTSDKKEAQKWIPQLKESIRFELGNRRVFQTILVDQPGHEDLSIRIKILEVSEGSRFWRSLNLLGEAKIKAQAVFFEASSSQSIGSIEVSGNSARNRVLRVPLYAPELFDDMSGRAVQAMSDELADYVQHH